ncbi:class I SAM-dependent methyltransferase [Pontibacter virosus]|uniref:Methyltransferase family protein n=1 Tax=Pontibacter virosus TaxID=1765052 RepID=A0A2U1B0Q6_9BACT|nr:class I SAM-dependent methyltransferase [Pontibacter virosus]PVY42161.1 methyltransferase family protein [Pontibacter virosus]
MTCPLCLYAGDFKEIKGPDSRLFLHCENCQLVFTEQRFLPLPEVEEKHYLTHENGIEHAGYVNFLNRAIQPTLPLLGRGMHGLDYGCGPTPTLSLLLEREGYRMDNYDPYFFPELKTEQVYDFVFATECFEHFFYPARELHLLYKLLKPGGLLTIMTEQWQETDKIPTWYYAKDPTHVVFYHSRTFHWIAQHCGFELMYTDNKRVVIIRKDK